MKKILPLSVAVVLLGAGCAAGQAPKASSSAASKSSSKVAVKKEMPTFTHSACENAWLALMQPKLADDVSPPADFPPPPPSLVPCFSVKWNDTHGQIFAPLNVSDSLSGETLFTSTINDEVLDYYEPAFRERGFFVERIGLKGKRGAFQMTFGKGGAWGQVIVESDVAHPDKTYIKVVFQPRPGLAGLDGECGHVVDGTGYPPASVIGVEDPGLPPLPPETEYCGYTDVREFKYVKMKFRSALIRPELLEYYKRALAAQGFTVREGDDFGPVLFFSKGRLNGEVIPFVTGRYQIYLDKVKS